MFRLVIKSIGLLSLLSAIQLCAVDEPDGPTVQMARVLQSRPDVVFFGDSTLSPIAGVDEDTSSTPTLLDKQLDGLTVGRYAQAGYHAEIFALFMDQLCSAPHPPQLIVVPINLRAFSPVWARDPGMQKAVVAERIRLDENRLLRSIKPIWRAVGGDSTALITRSDYMRSPVFRGDEQIGVVGQLRNGTVDEQFIMNYFYTLKRDHPQVAALREIARKAADNAIGAVFYVTPIDYQAISPGIAAELVDRVGKNIALIESQLAPYAPTLVDFSFGLHSRHFYYERHVNEHLKTGGRAAVAQQVAAAIRQFDAVAKLPAIKR